MSDIISYLIITTTFCRIPIRGTLLEFIIVIHNEIILEESLNQAGSLLQEFSRFCNSSPIRSDKSQCISSLATTVLQISVSQSRGTVAKAAEGK